MARSLWTGSISFGLVNVPVALYSAVRDLDVHFRQLHEKDGAPIDTRRFCAEEDKEVPYEAIGHGYELDDGKQVVLRLAREKALLHVDHQQHVHGHCLLVCLLPTLAVRRHSDRAVCSWELNCSP